MSVTRREVAFAVGLVSVAAACSNDVTDPSVDARVRFVNASPDSPALDALIGTANVVEALGAQRFTAYFIVNAGSSSLTMRPTAGGAGAAVQATATFEPSRDYSVLAVGAFDALELVVLTDDNTLPTAGNARIRVLHVAPSGATLDVYVTTPGASLDAAPPTVSSTSFKSVSAYMSMPIGTYQVRLVAAGTKTVEHDAGTFSFGAGEVHSIFVLDAPGGGPPLGVAAVVDAAGL
jgi:hypothetical protein